MPQEQIPTDRSGREVVKRAIRFQGPGRLPHDFPGDWGTDFAQVNMDPSPDARPPNGVDEWGTVWQNLGQTQLGEAKEFPLKEWSDFDSLNIPDIHDPRRWKRVDDARRNAGDKAVLSHGISIYERVHFLRGLENTWLDIYDSPRQLQRLLDLLVEMNLVAIQRYAAAGADVYIFADDWGLQDRLMISPDVWRAIWKPRYTRIYTAAHEAGLLTCLHSCGYIVDILGDLIEAGLDMVHMDQQENMGLEVLGERFGGRITFFSPVDIQTAMHRPLSEVRAYARQMARCLARPEGGFIPRWYTDPKGAGHRQDAIDAMCEEFLKISGEMYGA